ncbi:MAG: HAD-IIIC family phosphatase [Proteobacteria bacterium]|nr:HAD-IIIC family phosphatase [Pseudomonadota bacterium]
MTDFEKLLSTQSLAQLRAELSTGKAPASPAHAQQLAAHAARLAAPTHELRIGFVHTYTSDLLDPWLGMAAAVQGTSIKIHHAPYGLALQEAAPQSALVQHKPQLTVLLLQREDLHPALARPVTGLGVEGMAQLRSQALQHLQEIVARFREQPVGHLVVSLLPRIAGPALGLFDAQAEASEGAWWSGLKAELGQWLRTAVPSSLLLDLDEVLLQVGRTAFFDRRFWYSARFPFAPAAAHEISRRLVAIGIALTTPKAKVLVLDADNTLWGGVVGEDGFDGIKLGPDYPGNVYVDFQRRILDFQQRGLILAMCSKNNAADVDQVLKEHPHQVLRDERFAARRVNWVPKPENLVSLAKELNLGLDAFIFVDDSDHECAAVRHALPQVEVIQVPSRPTEIAGCLDQVARLEVLSLTAEDLSKTEMYAQERRRRELMDSADTGGDYLQRLGMKMSIRVDVPANVPRLAQLTQKTNQFNLTTRRYDEQQIQSFQRAEDWLVADFSLADTFGDSGVVGLALINLTTPQSARLDSFMMSCRVIGREAEGAFLHTLFRHLAERGVQEVSAEYLPTAKNDLVKNFLPDQGFEPLGDGKYRRDLAKSPPRVESEFPIEILLTAGGGR